MSLEKDIAMMVMLKKVKEMNMVNVVQNQDSFYQTLDTELDALQEKLQRHIGIHYVPNYISLIPATDYVYAYLDKNLELVISSVDQHPDDSELYDKESNFGKCKLNADVQIWHKKHEHIQTVQFQGIIKPTTCQKWFTGCKNLTEIKNMKNLDTSECINMDSMFRYCLKLRKLNLSNFDMNKVINMNYMFLGCFNLKTIVCSEFVKDSIVSDVNTYYPSNITWTIV